MFLLLLSFHALNFILLVIKFMQFETVLKVKYVPRFYVLAYLSKLLLEVVDLFKNFCVTDCLKLDFVFRVAFWLYSNLFTLIFIYFQA